MNDRISDLHDDECATVAGGELSHGSALTPAAIGMPASLSMIDLRCKPCPGPWGIAVHGGG